MAKRRRARGRTKSSSSSKRTKSVAVATTLAEGEVTTSVLACGAVEATVESVVTAASTNHPPREIRVPARSKVQVRAVFEGVSREDEVLNWSPGGVFVHTTDLLTVGEPVVITIGSDDGGRPLSLPGRVRWVSPFGQSEDPRPGMGIAFVGNNDGQVQRLATLLRPAAGAGSDETVG